MDEATVDVYSRTARDWEDRRPPDLRDARHFARRVTPDDRPLLDAGCGPGWHLPLFGPPAVALDATPAFLERVPTYAPLAARVRADLEALPFRPGSVGSVWANKSLVHLPRPAVAAVLRRLHQTCSTTAPAFLGLFEGALDDEEFHRSADVPFAGRGFSGWPEPLLRAVLHLTGWDVESIEVRRRGGDPGFIAAHVRRFPTLPATLDAGLRVLCVGVNPSPTSAELGVGYAHRANRFWPAALRSGLLTADRDVDHALVHHRVGMTDLSKRVTRRADELGAAELRDGHERLRLIVEWLRPGLVCVIGLTSWRVASGDRRAGVGLQPDALAGRPVYVMPNPSGLNAHDTVDTLAGHLRAVADLAGRS